MRSTLLKFSTFLIAFAVICGPFFVQAAIVPECNKGALNSTGTGFAKPCDFNSLMLLINNIIKFLVIDFATPLAAIAICWAGWKYLSSGGSEGNITQAKHILTNVVIGYVIALAAWLIVRTILAAVGFDPKDAFLKV